MPSRTFTLAKTSPAPARAPRTFRLAKTNADKAEALRQVLGKK